VEKDEGFGTEGSGYGGVWQVVVQAGDLSNKTIRLLGDGRVFYRRSEQVYKFENYSLTRTRR
jgi:hypothetical protein